ncbi:MAG: ATP-binding protein [Ktedonobacterales bacterium]
MSAEQSRQRSQIVLLEEGELPAIWDESEHGHLNSVSKRKVVKWPAISAFAPQQWLRGWRKPAIGYLLAALMQLAAIGITLELAVLFPQFAFKGVLPLLVVAVVALTFGAGPSLLATAIGAVLLDFVMLPPQFSLALRSSSQLLELILFLAVGGAVSVFPSQIARARRQVEAEALDAKAAHLEAKELAESLLEERSRLLAEEARLQAVFAAIPDRLTIFDATGTIMQLNPAAQQSAGSRGGPAQMEDLTQIYGLRTPAGDPFPMENLPLARALQGEQVHGVEIHMQDAVGGNQVILGSASPFYDGQGQLLGAVVSAHDITELRQIQQQTRHSLDALLAMAQSLVAVPDLFREHTENASLDSVDVAERRDTGPRRSAHEQATAHQFAKLVCGVLGCKRVGIVSVEAETETLHALAVVGLLPEQEERWWAEQQVLEAQHARLGAGGDPQAVADFRAGKTFILDMTQPPYDTMPNPFGITTQLVAPMRLGGRVVGLLSLDYGGPPHQFTEDEVAVARAIAQLGAMLLEREHLLHEQAVAQATVLALLESTRRMDEFLGVAGHELKTPLTTTSANAQFMERRLGRLKSEIAQLGEETAVYLMPFVQSLEQLTARVISGTRRQTRLIEDLLNVSRIGSGNLELRLEPCDLAALAHDCVEEQRLQLPERVITITTPGTPIAIMADAERVKQVVTNYLTNAVKYSRPSAPIQVSVEKEKLTAWVRVRDEGPGLPAAELERIWDRFYRVSDVAVQNGSEVGLGLGLYISRTIIEMQGGQVGVDSEPGKGSTFWFTLPGE